MVKLVKHEKRIVLDGGLLAEAGEALATAAETTLEKASDLNGESILAIMDQVLDSAGDLAVGPIREAAREGAVAIGDAVNTEVQQVVVFVDGSVGNMDLIRSGLRPGAELHVIDTKADGLAQMAEVLAGKSDVSAVHIISHGSAGQLDLGGNTVQFNNLSAAQASSLAQIGHSLSDSADVMVYGCDFAAGSEGVQAVEHIASLTGADVAASVDATGAQDLGGDWDFEVASGLIESAIVLDAPTRDQFLTVLGAVSDVVGANFGSDVDGNDLRVWLDANTGVNVNGSNELTSWVNQGRGTSFSFQFPSSLTNSTSPVYQTSGSNYVEFNGNDILSGVANHGLSGTEFEIFFVGSVDTANSKQYFSRMVSANNSANSSDFTGDGVMLLSLSGSTVTANRDIGTNYGADSSTSMSSAVWANAGDTTEHIINTNASGTTSNISLDNAAQTSGTLATSLGSLGTGSHLNSDQFNLGGRGNATQSFENATMNVREVMIFNRVLNDAERVIINNYLSNKWGQTISNDHYSGTLTTGIAGIGYEGASDQHNSATTGGLTMVSTDFLQDTGDYVMVARDTGASSSANDTTATIGGESIAYVGRTWEAEVTDAGSNGGNVQVTFDLSAFQTNITTGGANDGYRLIIDGTGNGFDASDTTVTSSTNSSGVVTFTLSASLLDGKQFTIGAVQGDSVAPVLDLNGGSAGTSHSGNYNASDIGSSVSLDTSDTATVTDSSNIKTISIDLTSSEVSRTANDLFVFGTSSNEIALNSSTTTVVSFGGNDYNVVTNGGNSITISANGGGDFNTDTARDIIRDLRYKNAAGASATVGDRVFGISLTDASDNVSTAVNSTISVDTVAPVFDLDSDDAGNDFNDYLTQAEASATNGVSLDDSANVATLTESGGISTISITVTRGQQDPGNEFLRFNGASAGISSYALHANGTGTVTLNDGSGDVIYSINYVDNAEAGDDTDTGTMTITRQDSGDMNQAQVLSVIHALAYRNNDGTPTTTHDRAFQITLTDSAGNTSVATSTMQIDTTEPTVSLDTGTSNNYSQVVTSTTANSGVSLDNATSSGTDAAVTEASTNLASIEIVVLGPDGLNPISDSNGDGASEVLAFGATNVLLGNNGSTTILTNYTASVSSGVITISRTDGDPMTNTEVETILQTATYKNLDTTTPTEGDRSFAVKLTDRAGNQQSTASTATITIDDTAPTVDLDGSDATTENYTASLADASSGVAITSSSAISESHNEVDTITIVISGELTDQTNEVLKLGTSGETITFHTDDTASNATVGGVAGVDASFTNTNHTLVLSKNGGGSFSTTDIQNILNALQYQNTKGSPTDGDRVFTITVNDSAGNTSNPQTATITLDNTDPVIGLDGATTTWSVDVGDTSGGVSLDNASNAATVTDATANELTSLKLAITGLADGNSETLTWGAGASDNVQLNTASDHSRSNVTVGGVAGVDVDFTSVNDTVTITKNDGSTLTAAQVQNILRALQYANSQGTNATEGARVLTITATDASGNTGTATTTIEIDNTDPTVRMNGATTNYSVSVGNGAINESIDGGSAAAVTDNTADEISSVTIVVGGVNDGSNEKLAWATGVADNVNIGGANETVNGANIAGVTGLDVVYNNTTNTLTIDKADSSTLTAAQVQTILQALTYSHAQGGSATSGDRTLAITATDSAGNTGSATTTVTVDNVGPVIDLDPSDSGSANHSANVNTNGGNAGSGNGTLGTSLDDSGDALSVTEASAVSSIVISIADADIDEASDEKLLFLNAAGDTAVATIDMAANDSTNTNATIGGVSGVDIAFDQSGDPNTFTITKNGGGTFSATEMRDILRAINYANDNGSPTDGTRTFSISATDELGNSTGTPATTAITLAANAAPAVDLDTTDGTTNNFSTAVQDATNGVSLDASASITDDGDAITQIVIAVSGVNDGANERIGWGSGASNEVALNATNSESTVDIGGVSSNITYNQGTGNITITKAAGNFTVAEARAVVQALEYLNAQGASATDGQRDFAITLSDSQGASSTTRTASIVVDNTDPTLDLDTNASGNTYDVSVNAATAASGVSLDDGSNTATVTDNSANAISSFTVTIGGVTTDAASETIDLNGTDSLALSTDNSINNKTVGAVAGIDAAYVHGTRQITFTKDAGGTFTAAEVQAIIRAIEYKNAAGSPADGDRTFAFNVADTSGNSANAITTISIDNTGPTASINISDTALKKGETATVTITFSEPVTGFSNTDLTVPSGTLTAVTTTDGGTTWTATFTPTDNHEDATNVISLAATYTDTLGNTGSTQTSSNYAVDTQNPGQAGTPDLATSSDTGTSNTDNVTNDNTPTFTGSGGTPGDTARIYADGVLVGSAVVDGSGNWNVTTSTLSDGSYNITARFADPAGNESGDSTPLTPVVIDTTPPGTPTINDVEIGDTSISGTAAPGESVRVTLPGGSITTVTADGNGNWSISGITAIANGNSVSAVAVDAAGNTSGTATDSAINTDPVLANNDGWSGDQGTTGIISASSLLVTDSENTAAEITFTVTNAPNNGTLTLNGVALGVGDTFTQADINAGNVSYTHTGNGSTTDSAQFNISDPVSSIGNRTFSFTIAPNPTSETADEGSGTETVGESDPDVVVTPVVETETSDPGDNSLFSGDIGEFRSEAEGAGIFAASGFSGDGIESNGPLSLDNNTPGGGEIGNGAEPPAGNEVDNLFGGGLDIDTAAGPDARPNNFGPDAQEGDINDDIQRFATANDEGEALSEGHFNDLGFGNTDLGGDDGLGEGDPGQAGATPGEGGGLNGDLGGILFTQNQTGDEAFGVRAGDFFNVFSESGEEGTGDQGLGQTPFVGPENNPDNDAGSGPGGTPREGGNGESGQTFGPEGGTNSEDLIFETDPLLPGNNSGEANGANPDGQAPANGETPDGTGENGQPNPNQRDAREA